MTIRNRDLGAAVSLRNITKRFDTVTAVDGIDLDIEGGSFFSLLGPSGCGKSTLLRIIAGLEHADCGSVAIGGTNVDRLEARSRPTAMVFQNYALFPHMTVGQNVGYGLKVRGLPGSARRKKVAEALARVDLEGFEDRPVVLLSGGQQQRVALARALAVAPRVLLFDEPLSNLDVTLREQTRRELKLLQTDLQITSIYVTHDQQEALALSDRIAVMRAGSLIQVDRPEHLFDRPKTAFVARFLGINVIDVPEFARAMSPAPASYDVKAIAIRPDHLVPCSSDAPGAIPARIRSRQFLGIHVEWLVETDVGDLRMWLAAENVPEEALYVRAIKSRPLTS